MTVLQNPKASPAIKLACLIIMWFCLLTLTIGQMVPLYFTTSHLSVVYNSTIFCLLAITLPVSLYQWFHQVKNRTPFEAGVITAFISAFILLVVGIFTFVTFMAVWTETGVLYVSKHNPNLKIVTRYINEGAFGGGTDPDDYKVVVKRPILPVVVLETKVDTNHIDKSEWIRAK